MITINFFKDSNYTLDENKLKKAIEETLIKNKVQEAIVDLAVVGEDKMDEINKKYYSKDDKKHPIFTFPVSGIFENYLGEIVISEKEVQNRGEELAAHGTLHLLGIHH